MPSQRAPRGRSDDERTTAHPHLTSRPSSRNAVVSGVIPMQTETSLSQASSSSIHKHKKSHVLHRSAAPNATSDEESDERHKPSISGHSRATAKVAGQSQVRQRKSKEKEKEKEKRKERRAENPRPIAPPVPPPKDASIVSKEARPSMTGALAHAEFDRLKAEIERLKQTVTEGKKANKSQAKVIDELKSEINKHKNEKNDREVELKELKAQSAADNELVSVIEQAVLCQICMDMLLKPFSIAPCGHILCMTCLQGWFRQAPTTEDDMDLDPEDDARFLLRRTKTCPCCRSVVTRRPAPVFVVKSITSALLKAKNGDSRATPLRQLEEDIAPDADPWEGLFPTGDESFSSDEDDDDEDDDLWGDRSDSDVPLDFDEMPAWGLEYRLEDEGPWGYGDPEDGEGVDEEDGTDDGNNESDEDESEVDADLEASTDGGYEYGDSEDEGPQPGDVYMHPRWAPPARPLSEVEDAMLDGQQKAMLRRGCSVEMLNHFAMEYSHALGLIAFVNAFGENYDPDVVISTIQRRRRCRIFLGWNIVLADSDSDGKTFILRMLADMHEYPPRWDFIHRHRRRTQDATRLVREQEIADYDTTDSEAWIM